MVPCGPNFKWFGANLIFQLLDLLKHHPHLFAEKSVEVACEVWKFMLGVAKKKKKKKAVESLSTLAERVWYIHISSCLSKAWNSSSVIWPAAPSPYMYLPRSLYKWYVLVNVSCLLLATVAYFHRNFFFHQFIVLSIQHIYKVVQTHQFSTSRYRLRCHVLLFVVLTLIYTRSENHILRFSFWFLAFCLWQINHDPKFDDCPNISRLLV